MGLPSPSPRSVAGLLINEGIFGASPSEPVLEVIEKLKRRFDDATDALDACDREQRHVARAGGRPCWSTGSSAPTRMRCTGRRRTSGTCGWR